MWLRESRRVPDLKQDALMIVTRFVIIGSRSPCTEHEVGVCMYHNYRAVQS